MQLQKKRVLIDLLQSVKPEDKIKVIKDEQAKGHIVAMTGDGTNDAPCASTSEYRISYELRDN